MKAITTNGKTITLQKQCLCDDHDDIPHWLHNYNQDVARLSEANLKCLLLGETAITVEDLHFSFSRYSEIVQERMRIENDLQWWKDKYGIKEILG